MRRHHTGSGRGTTVFPPDWSDHAGTVVEQFMLDAVVNLRRSGSTRVFNQSTGVSDNVPYPPFAINVKADIQPLTAGGAPTGVVEEQVWVLGYRIAVPRDTAPTVGQLDEGITVDVLSCAGEPTLVGQSLKVNDVVRGTHRLQRILIADANS